MKTFVVIVGVVVVLLAAAFGYLLMTDIPAPTTTVEKPLDDRLED